MKELRTKRQEKAFNKVLRETNTKIEKFGLDELKLPCRHRVPARLTRPATAHAAESIEEHFRVQMFELIDAAITDLSDRFTNSDDLRPYNRLEEVLVSGTADDRAHIFVSTYREIDWALLAVQLPLF